MSKRACPWGLANSFPPRSSRLPSFLCILFVPIGTSGKTSPRKRHSERDIATIAATGGNLGYCLVYADDGPDQRAGTAIRRFEVSLTWGAWKTRLSPLIERSNEFTDWLKDQDLADTIGSSDYLSPCIRDSSSLTLYTFSTTPSCSA